MAEKRRGPIGSFKVATALGIPIRLHFTFLILVAWAGLESANAGRGFLSGVMFILLLFACVVLHELGHAAMALRFGVKTKEIVLYPIGGVARLTSMPSGKAEFLIAIAGPAMNVVLAALLIVVAFALGVPVMPTVSGALPVPSIIPSLIAANVILFLFNLLPAFPMDGGRVLRAMLSFYLPEDRATHIAAVVGQVVAVGFAIWGIQSRNPIMILIAFFVFMGATQESAFMRGRAAVRGRRAREAMVTRFETLAPQDSVGRATELLLETHQHDFPVVDAWGRLAGLLTRPALLEALPRVGRDTPVFEVMRREVAVVPPDLDLESVLQHLSQHPQQPLMVVADGKLLGMITGENLGELIEVTRRARRADS